MNKKLECLEQSWKAFISTEKACAALGVRTSAAADDRRFAFSPGPVPAKTPAPHHGGLFNNLNDPSKFPKRDYSFKPRKVTPRPPVVTFEDSPPSEDGDCPLVCRSLSRPASHYFAPRASYSKADLTKNDSCESTGELTVSLKRLALNPRTPMKRRHSRPLTGVRSREKSFVSKGLDTTDPDQIVVAPCLQRSGKGSASVLRISTQLASLPSTGPRVPRKRTLISKYLDHMLREQSRKRIVSKPTRAKAVIRAQQFKGGNKEAFRALTGLDSWEEFGEVLIGERAKISPGRKEGVI